MNIDEFKEYVLDELERLDPEEAIFIDVFYRVLHSKSIPYSRVRAARFREQLDAIPLFPRPRTRPAPRKRH